MMSIGGGGKPEESGNFLLNSAYLLLEDIRLVTNDLHDLQKKVFPYLWKSLAPLKVVVLFWEVLLD